MAPPLKALQQQHLGTHVPRGLSSGLDRRHRGPLGAPSRRTHGLLSALGFARRTLPAGRHWPGPGAAELMVSLVAASWRETSPGNDRGTPAVPAVPQILQPRALRFSGDAAVAAQAGAGYRVAAGSRPPGERQQARAGHL